MVDLMLIVIILISTSTRIRNSYLAIIVPIINIVYICSVFRIQLIKSEMYIKIPIIFMIVLSILYIILGLQEVLEDMKSDLEYKYIVNWKKDKLDINIEDFVVIIVIFATMAVSIYTAESRIEHSTNNMAVPIISFGILTIRYMGLRYKYMTAILVDVVLIVINTYNSRILVVYITVLIHSIYQYMSCAKINKIIVEGKI